MNKQTVLQQWLASLQHTATPSIDECIDQLGNHIDWLYRLQATEQDPEWHAEGNVYIHTGMVLEALYQLLATQAQHIQGEQRQALILAALLHDIAKPVRTKRQEVRGIERIISPQHEAYGRNYLAFKLIVLPLDFKVIWQVLHLVGEHHRPRLFVFKNQSQRHFWSLSRLVNLELLYWLEMADMTGRICHDTQEQLATLEEFKFLAQEYGTWNQTLEITPKLESALHTLSSQAQNYVYEHTRYGLEQGLFTQVEEGIATSYAYRDNHAHLVILCGASGSGKSTWVAKQYPDYQVISLDSLRQTLNGKREDQKNRGQVLQLAKTRLKQALAQKENIVWDATNLRSDFRKIIADLGRDYHALVSMDVFLLPEKQLLKNNRERKYSVPDSVITKQIESYQMPLLDEVHQYQVVGFQGGILYSSHLS